MTGEQAWEASLRAADLGVWRGKKIFVDFDETLVEASRAFEPPDERGYGPRGPQVPMDDGFVYELTRVNHEAVAVLRALAAHGAMPIITSVGRAEYVEKASAAIGLGDVVHGVFGNEHLAYERDGFRRTSPKDYSPVIADVEEPSPLANCLAVGNDPLSDVPIAPLGLVTVLTVMSFSFLDVILSMTRLLEHGEGSFEQGFDRMIAAGVSIWGRAELCDEPRYKFLERCAGRARIVYFDRDAVEDAGAGFLLLGG